MAGFDGRIKRLKDPVYGYIELDAAVCRNIVDTAEFQRLRRVVQTSYGSLYPSALHNRFVHSLGVYHLGLMASEALDASVKKLFSSAEDNREILPHWEQSLETYKLACLLHDFGHAPFSHTGEEFFVSEGDSLNEDLAKVVGDELFSDDIATRFRGSPAAPHEIMSAMLGLQRFAEHIPDRVLFARAITGYDYDRPHSVEESLDNILIHMLNSSTIDVDRLDYLIRDAYFVGFESVSIDYRRLLESLRVVKTTADKYELAFSKSALSVLESVIYARDFEKKWVQSHPAIQYDQFLVQHAIRAVEAESPFGTLLFSRQALTCEGVESEEPSERVRLVTDDDVVFIAKNRIDDPLVVEYFDRSARKHPVWKSEAEFSALFASGGELSSSMEETRSTLKEISETLEARGADALLRSDTIDLLMGEIEGADTSDQRVEMRVKDTERLVDFLKALRAFCEGDGRNPSRRIAFDFVLVPAEGFKSGFGGKSLKDIPIVFDDEPGLAVICKFGEVSKVLTNVEQPKPLFYLYHKEANSRTFPKAELVAFFKDYYAA